MLKFLVRSGSLTAFALVLMLVPSAALAAPMTYAFDSGSVSLRVTRSDTGASVLVNTPFNLSLGGSYVTIDPTLGTNGTLVGLELIPNGTINLDLDESQVALDTLDIMNAVLSHDLGATAALSALGAFSLDTHMTADIAGVFPDTSTFGPSPIMSNVSGATGTVGISGNTLTLGMLGINLATFDQVANPDPNAPQLILKADFQFIGTLVPEPGTALLLGLGLAGLGISGRQPLR